MAVQTRPHDVQDGAGAQDGAGHIGTDEGGGEDGGRDVEDGRGVMGQRGEEGGDGAGESRAHEGGEAERPDAGAGLSVGQASPVTACLSPSHVAQVAARAGTVIVGREVSSCRWSC